MHEASFENLALAGALLSSVIAGQTLLFARQPHGSHALRWWSAALALEGLRLLLIGWGEALAWPLRPLATEGGHAIVALLAFAGARALVGAHLRNVSVAIAAGAFGAAMVAGALLPPSAALITPALLAAAAALAAGAAVTIRRGLPGEPRAPHLIGLISLVLMSLGLALHGMQAMPGVPGATEFVALTDITTTQLALIVLIALGQQREQQLHRSAAERIAAEQQRFRDIAEVAGDWIWEMGPDLRFTYFSDRIQEVTGIDPAHLLGKTRREVLGGDAEAPSWRRHLADLEARRPFRDFEYALRGGDGRVRHVRISGKPVFDPAGRFLGYRGTGTDLTSEIEAKAHAKRLDRRLKDAFESMPLGIGLFDAEDRLLFCNSKHALIYPEAADLMVPGRRFEDIFRGLAARQIYSAEGEALERLIEDRLAHHRNPSGSPIEQQLRDGRWVQISETRTTDGGTVVCWTEITSLKRREHALKILVENSGGDRFLDAAAEALAVGLDCRWTGISRLVGKDRAEVVSMWDSGKPGECFVYDLEATPCAEVVRTTYCSYPDRVAELFPQDELLAHMGARSYKGHVFHDSAGAQLGLVFAINDRPDAQDSDQRSLVELITRWVAMAVQQQSAEQAVRQKSAFVELSKMVAAAANEAVTVEDALQVALDQVCTHLGWPVGHAYLIDEADPNRLLPTEIWHSDDPERFKAFREVTMATPLALGEGTPGRVLATGRAQWTEDCSRIPPGPRLEKAGLGEIRSIAGFPLMIGAEVVGVLEFFSNCPTSPNPLALEVMSHVGNQLGRVIERARAARQLLLAKEAAEQADRAKSEFLATMSHELRTPLNAIIGFSEVMIQEMFGPIGHQNYRDYAQDILSSGTHLLSIINDILDVSKAEAGMISLSEQSVPITELVEACLRLMRPRADEKDLNLETDLPDDAVCVMADRLRLKQILLNLLSNAIKFTLSGTITVRLRADPEEGVLLQVTDTGIGIAEADLARVMEPFVQADSTFSRPHEGTGLGLPLSRALVELHGGQLTLESTFGTGTVVTVRLPLHRLVGASNAA